MQKTNLGGKTFSQTLEELKHNYLAQKHPGIAIGQVQGGAEGTERVAESTHSEELLLPPEPRERQWEWMLLHLILKHRAEICPASSAGKMLLTASFLTRET